ncbi:dienelactone hydrolase family protein [Flagellimonas lutimaris]|uniref:dienelactone hydrolase family protein n=1 Tax=Flagellimonas lutimaris TaxID=475082 RepID=UPI003F5CF6D8
MKNHGFNTLQVSDGTEEDAYFAIPEEGENFPGIILLQEAFGVNHHIRSVAERLCVEGYAVIAPDLYHRTAPRLEVPYSDFSEAIAHYQSITKEGLKQDLQAVYECFQQMKNIRKDKIGSIGFCMGGRASFLANASLPLEAAVSYYGGSMHQWADEAPNLHGDHLFFWGGMDEHIATEHIETTISAVKNAGKPYTNVLFSYADHGFHCDERESYHPLAAKEAWAMTLAFFDSRL